LTQILEERDWQNDSFQDAEKICGVYMQILVADGKAVDFYEKPGLRELVGCKRCGYIRRMDIERLKGTSH
jgi:hypothetical protein